jgi:hypothetical protein
MKEKRTDIHFIIDAGATKTEFAVLRGEELVHQFFATGINANYSSDEQIDKVFSHFVNSLPAAYTQPDLVTYYGAGCAGEQNAMRIAVVIAKYFASASFKNLFRLDGSLPCLVRQSARPGGYSGNRFKLMPV